MKASSGRLERSVGATIFGTDVEGYHGVRMDYPAGLYEAIAGYCGEAGRILEVGAGTGLATRALIARFHPDQLLAVEADPAMAQYLASAIPSRRLSVVRGKFESVPLDRPFDLIACAAAFHWLEPATALPRMRELLVPGGTLAIWWNTYREPGVGDPFADAVIPLLEGVEMPPSEGKTGHYSLDVELHRAALAEAGFVRFETHRFRRERMLDTETMIALYASYSYIRVLPEKRRRMLLERIEDLARREFGHKVPNVVLSQLYLVSAPCRRAEAG